MMAGRVNWVLDSSAVLALIRGEPGGEHVGQLTEEAVISSVNWSEVVQRMLKDGMDLEVIRMHLDRLGLLVMSFSGEDAEATATLRRSTRAAGLSLADRACLALAQDLEVPAVTADRAWSRVNVDVGVEVRMVR